MEFQDVDAGIACLFLSEGVGFSGLLNQTGRFEPDAQTGGGGEGSKQRGKGSADGSRASGGDAALLPVHPLWLWGAVVSRHLSACVGAAVYASLLETTSLTGNDVVKELVDLSLPHSSLLKFQ